MCHGSIDPKFLMRDVETRYCVTAVEPTRASTGKIPPELMGGLRGVWARIVAKLAPPMRKPRVARRSHLSGGRRS